VLLILKQVIIQMFAQGSSWSDSAVKKALAVHRTTACQSSEEPTYFVGRDWVPSSVVARMVEEPAKHLLGEVVGVCH
jgi:hypothetical protein